MSDLSRLWALWSAAAAATSLLACQNPAASAAGATPTAAPAPAAGQVVNRKVVTAPPLTPASSTLVGFEQLTKPAAREAWFGLTASDGSGLEITNVEVKSVLDGPLAFTELHLYFRNPEARIREGKFRITLPDGAAISRFAMENDGQFMEAEVVEKQLARRAYEDFLHRRQDPALLEQAAGNEFAARVFPIPANGVKHLVVSFSQELTNDSYRLPLRGLPKLGSLAARVQVLGADGNYRTTTLQKQNWKPDADLVAQGKTLDAVVAGDVVAMRVPVVSRNAVYRPAAVSILFDTSASRGLGFAADLARLESMVAEMKARVGAATPLEIIAFDQTAETVFTGTFGEFQHAILRQLQQRGALGASDIGLALERVSKSAGRQVVIISDAVPTAGAEKAELIAKAKSLAGRGVNRLDVALVGGIRDSVGAAALSNAGLVNVGAVLDVDRLGSREVARRLGVAMNVNIPVAVADAQWVWPRTIAAAQSGDSVIIYARASVRHDMFAPAITLGATPSRLTATKAAAPLLDRSLIRAQIAELEAQLAAAATPELAHAIKTKLIDVSVKNRVMASVTSMLVLESDADYDRYQIPRTALADILSVGNGGVEWLKRKAPVMQIAKVAPVQKTAGYPHDHDKAKKMADTRSANAATKDGEDADDSDGKFDRADSGVAVAGKAEEEKEVVVTGRVARPTVETIRQERSVSPNNRPVGGAASGISPDVVAVGPSAGSAAAPSPSEPPPPSVIDRVERRPVPVREGAHRIAIAEDRPSESTRLAGPAPLTGELARIMSLIKRGQVALARDAARAWHDKEPGDVLALIALGEAFEASKDTAQAARAYGSIIDLFPERADLRRFAGQRLARMSTSVQSGVNDLLIDTYRKAVADRPDHPSSHRMLAYALARAGKFAEAFAAIAAGLHQDYRGDSFRGVDRVLRDDVGILAAAWRAAEPKAGAQIAKLTSALGATVADVASTRFILYWETDANDVDFHIQDARGGHAFYSQPILSSGGELYADVTTGYGPECFAIHGTPKAGPYRLSIHYYSMGPMGYGMGAVEILRHDGKGHLTFETRPYTVMVDQAYVDLGTIK
ncbi:MAG: hypothetical protein KBG15_07080 [Kofleriaceae bacterium]|nr:hypothetical protein [Kofleriaceae bacterium]